MRRLHAIPALLAHVVLLTRGPESLEPVVEQFAADVTALKIRVGHLEAAKRKRVAFSAYITEGPNIRASPNQIVPFNNVLTNTGGAYNNQTGIFTAPFTGDYFFIVSADVSANYNQMEIRRNNVPTLKADKDDKVGTHVTGTGILDLVAGDAVTVTHASRMGYVEDGRGSTFSGFFLGESTQPDHPAPDIVPDGVPDVAPEPEPPFPNVAPEPEPPFPDVAPEPEPPFRGTQ